MFGGVGGPEVPCLEGPLYSVVGCIMGNGHIGPLPPNGQMRMKTLHSRNFVGGGGGGRVKQERKIDKIQVAQVALIQSSTDMILSFAN